VTIICTRPDRCQGYRDCLRACPVEAIEFRAGQTWTVEERCIACGACVSACTQGAKTIRDDVALVKQALTDGRHVVASVAPSVSALFPSGSFEFQTVTRSLRRLAFVDTDDTTTGAAMVGDAYGRLLSEARSPQPLIGSSCPGIVYLVQQHFPHLVPHLAPVVSPAVAHSRWLKQIIGPKAFVVFIGPCLAAKLEADDETLNGSPDAALTFSELKDWLEAEGIATFPSNSDAMSSGTEPGEQTRFAVHLFSPEGGLARIAMPDDAMAGKRVVTASGFELCRTILDSLNGGQLEADLLELMLCPGGCLNGPGMPGEERSVGRRQWLFAYAQQSTAIELPPRSEWPSLHRAYANPTPTDPSQKLPAQESPRGKDLHPASIRDRAVATLRGIAAPPVQTHREEAMAKVIFDLTPNLVIMVDEDLRIVALSPSAERAFGCDLASMRDRPLTDILTPVDDFVKARRYNRAVIKSKVCYRPDLIVEQTVVPATEENALVAIMRDITTEEKQKAELAQLMQETITRTQQVIDFQMQVAHEIASLLGETTAKTKIQLGRLIQLVQGLEDLEVP
jgi:PAS domain S-box-containing protein